VPTKHSWPSRGPMKQSSCLETSPMTAGTPIMRNWPVLRRTKQTRPTKLEPAGLRPPPHEQLRDPRPSGQGSASVHAIWRRWAPRRRGGSSVRYCSCTLRDSASHSRRLGGSLASRPRRRGVGLRVLATEERRARGDAVPDRVVDLVGPGRRATGPESDERTRHGTGLPWSAA